MHLTEDKRPIPRLRARARRLAVLAAAAAAAAAQQASAQAIAVRPTSVELARDQRATVLNVTNTGASPTVVQARAFVWKQANGQEELDPTTDLVVSPPFAEIAPGQTQIVRLVLRTPKVDHEMAYRVVLDQVPQAGADGVRLAVRLSLPVFAEPDLQAKAKLEWKVVVHPNGEGELVGANAGPRHVRLSQIKVTLPGKPPALLENGAVRYLLPGSQRPWRLGPVGTDVAQVRLSATTDQGAIDAAATVATTP